MKCITRLYAVVVLFVGLVAGCNKSGGGGSKGGNEPVPPGAPQVTFSPQQMNLDTTIKQASITITNQDTAQPVTLVKPDANSPLSSDFDKSNCNSTLAPTASCSYNIVFDPTSGKAEQQNISMQYHYSASDGDKLVSFGTLVVNYKSGMPEPVLISDPSSIIFDVSKGNNQTALIRLTNSVPENAIQITNTAPTLNPPFSVVFTNCQGLKLKQDSCQYQISFTGTTSTDSKTLTISYSYTGNDGTTKVKTLQTIVQATAPSPFKVFLNHSHGNVIPGQSNPLILKGKVNNSQASNQAKLTSRYGFFDSLVIYNPSSTSTSFQNLDKMPIVDEQNKPISDLKIDYSKCGVNPSLAPKKMCAFQVIYKPTKATTSTMTAYLNLTDTNGHSLKIPIQYSAEDESQNSEYSSNSKVIDFLNSSQKIGVYNNCTSPLWIQSQSNSKMGTSAFTTDRINPKEFFVLDDAIIKSVTDAGISDYTLDNGYASLNIHAKFGCDSNKKNCSVGEDVQPQIFPLFEGSLGCKKGPCRGGLDPANPADVLDLSLLQGFNQNLALDIWTDDAEQNVACFSNVESSLKKADCPSNENLSSTPNTWAVMDKDDNRWNWTDEQPPLGWVPDYQGAIADIGQSVWTSAIGSVDEISNPSANSSSIRHQLYSWKTSGLNFKACNDSTNSGICDGNPVFPVFPYWTQDSYSPFNVYCETGTPNNHRDPNTVFSMHALNLNLVHKSNGYLGCASPAKYLGASYSDYNAPALASQCLYVGSLFPSTLPPNYGNIDWTAVPYFSRYVDRNYDFSSKCTKDAAGAQACLRPSDKTYNAVWSNQRIMFENPYHDVDFVSPLNSHSNEYESPSAKIYQELVQFCTNHRDFCTVSGGGSRDSLAGLIGSMGPISTTQFYKTLKQKGGPNYIWQYGDQDATRTCGKAGVNTKAKYVVLFCGKTSTGQSDFTFPDPK